MRGSYTAALATRKVDWTRKHEYYAGPLSREALLAALDDKQRHLLATLETVDIGAPIDWDGTPFTFALFTWSAPLNETCRPWLGILDRTPNFAISARSERRDEFGCDLKVVRGAKIRHHESQVLLRLESGDCIA